MDWLVPPAHAQAEQISKATQVAGNAADTLISQGGIYGSIAVIVGLAAVAIIIVLGLVIRGLWNTIKDRDVLIATLQEKRTTDAATSAKLLAEVATTGSASIASSTLAQAELTKSIQGVGDCVKPQSEEHKRMLAGLDRNDDKIDDLRKLVQERRP